MNKQEMRRRIEREASIHGANMEKGLRGMIYGESANSPFQITGIEVAYQQGLFEGDKKLGRLPQTIRDKLAKLGVACLEDITTTAIYRINGKIIRDRTFPLNNETYNKYKAAVRRAIRERVSIPSNMQETPILVRCAEAVHIETKLFLVNYLDCK